MNENQLIRSDYDEFATPAQILSRQLGFFMLVIFAVIRPVTLIVKSYEFAGINILELFGVGIAYCILLPLLTCIKQIRIDRMNFIMLLFCLYVINSILWGSELRIIAIIILPLLFFFSVRLFIINFNELKTLLLIIFYSFLIPLFLSIFNIIVGRSITMIEYWNELPRHAGAFSGPHTFGYQMLLVSFFFCILNRIYPAKSTIAKIAVYFCLLLSIFCLFQSHTRTVIIGLIIFWYIYIFGNSKKMLIAAIIISIAMGFLFQGYIQRLIWKTPENIDIERATSGRTSMFLQNFELFKKSSLAEKIMGQGLHSYSLYGYHNDFMRLLISLGIIGLSLYLLLLFHLLWDIYLYGDKTNKYLFGAILISVAAMNFGSNGFVFRIELSQYFWLIMGIFYNFNIIGSFEHDTKTS